MKIAICTPHHGDVSAEYAYSLSRLLLKTVQTPIEFNGQVTVPQFEIFLRSAPHVAQLRNLLVGDALKWGANHILWIDADQKFRDDSLLRLLTLGLRVVGANYPRRLFPHDPAAVGLDGRLVYTTEELAKMLAVQEVRSLGLGFCLIDCTVLDDLERWTRSQGRETMWPLFDVRMIGDGSQVVSEDVFFFTRLREAGISIHVDHGLSWFLGHVHQRTAFLADKAADSSAGDTQAKVHQPLPKVRVTFGQVQGDTSSR